MSETKTTTVKGIYPDSEGGNFRIIDTIPVPHPYCITPKHLDYNDGVYLTKDTVREAEGKGAKCDICRKLVKEGKQDHVLTIDEHKQALLVSCKVDIQPVPDELRAWLLSIKAEAEANGYAGFAFTRV